MATAPTATLAGRFRVSARRRPSLWRTPRTRVLLVAAVLGAVILPIVALARVYTDVLWYRELGQEEVFWTTTAFRVLIPAVVGLGTTCVLLVDLAVVDRLTRRAPAPHPAVAPLWRHRRLLHVPAAIGGGLVAAERHGSAWPSVLLWSHRQAFGVTDPLFHRDVGFFVFSMPLQVEAVGWLLETLVMAAAVAAAAYALAGRRPARAHVCAFVGLALLVLAWRLRLDQLALALPHRGAVVPGASYTDVHVRLPVLQTLTYVSLAGAAVAAYGAVRPIRAAWVVGLCAVVLLAAGASRVLPWAVQRFEVAPQVLGHERPYLADAIAATRRAFALDEIRVRPLPARARLRPADLKASRATIENVPLWDARVLLPAMNELETIGSYYRFRGTSLDRYTVRGRPRLMMVAARELDLSSIARRARTWTNTRFAYTHGYGVAAVEAGGVTTDRLPRFSAQGFARGGRLLGLAQPRIYVGARTGTQAPYIVLPSHRGEVEQPAPGSRAPAYHYDGVGGIPLSGLVRRAAFALRFADLKLLLTGTVSGNSSIMLRRSARERVHTLAPFLWWDAHPQTTVAGGRVQYLFHGYTTSARYPYSEPVQVAGRRVNYMRASALAAVDSFTGRVRMYAIDGADPILRAWMGAYPTLFEPASRLPVALRPHLRYPHRLFAAQARAYQLYHAGDVTAFWNGADAWRAAGQLAGPVEHVGEIHFPHATAHRHRRLEPSYLLARLPGERRQRLVLTEAFTPRGRENLVGYMAGAVDGLGRPQLTVLSLARDRLTIGPTQATRQILATRAVTRQLEVLNRESRDLGKNSVDRTILGAPRLVPVAGTLVHVQPIYVTAVGSGLPRLQLVTVLVGGRVGYGPDLMTALRRAVGPPAARRPVPADGGARSAARPPPSPRRSP